MTDAEGAHCVMDITIRSVDFSETRKAACAIIGEMSAAGYRFASARTENEVVTLTFRKAS